MKIGGVFDSLTVTVPSPKAKKQSRLSSFWKRDPAPVAKEAPMPVRENKRKDTDAASVEAAGGTISKKAKVTATPAKAPRAASVVSEAAEGNSGRAASAGPSVEAEQDSDKATTPSVDGSEGTAGSAELAASTALTTPADELDKRLGDDVEAGFADEVDAEEA